MWITKQVHQRFVKSPTVTFLTDPNGWYRGQSEALFGLPPLYCIGASRQEVMGSAGERTR